MKKVFYLIALGAIVLASCAKTDDTPQPNEERKYSFSIGAEREVDEDSSSQTRLEMINGVHHWSVGDKVGMFVHRPNGVFIHNVAMTGTHEQPTTSTNFVGELTEGEVSMFDPNGRYSYLTYFPHNSTTTARFELGVGTEISFSVPQTISVRKNEFPSDNVFMYSYVPNIHPITWLDESGEQQWGERIAFNYKHALSYLRVKLDINLMGLPVTKIEVNSIDALSGILTVNAASGAITNGSNSVGNLVVNIEGGMNLGDEIYIPVPNNVYRSGTKFTFTFSNGVTYEKTIPSNLTLQRGKIHNIAFKLPFIADFEKYGGLPYFSSFFPYAPGETFDYLGHTYRGYAIALRDPIYIATGDSVVFGVLETPALNLSGKTNISVEVRAKMYAGVVEYMNYMRTNSVIAGYYGVDYNYNDLLYNANTRLAERVTKDYSISGITLTPSTSKIAIGANFARIYRLEVYPL